MDRLSSKQKEVLQAILDYTKEKKYPPTVRELGEMVGLQSSSTVQGHLERLKLKGLISWEPCQPRTLKVLKLEQKI